jgi:hypothetical protein
MRRRLIFFILLGVLLLFFFLKTPAWWISISPDNIDRDTFLRTVKTGDLLLFSNKNVSTFYETFVPITHVGVLAVSRNGEIFIVETHAEGDGPGEAKGRSGVHVYPIEVRLDEGGCIYHASIKTPTHVRYLEDMQIPDVPYNKNFMVDETVCRLTSGLVAPETETSMHCGVYSLQILRHLGVEVPFKKCISPAELLDLDLHLPPTRIAM